MNRPFDVYMIRILGDEVSETYANYCKKSWQVGGFDVNFFDAVTPENNDLENVLRFRKVNTPQENACFASHYKLWQKSADTNRPILVLEHDAYLVNPDMIQYNPHVHLIYFGQHCMEAYLINPWWAAEMCKNMKRLKEVWGPFGEMEYQLGMRLDTKLARKGRPHIRFLGPYAPVQHVIIPELGTSILHKGKGGDEKTYTSSRVDANEKNLFRIVSLEDINRE